MKASALPKAVELQLLKRLATDDGFRSMFEANPRKALAGAGVDEVMMKGLDPMVLVPGTLADKDVMLQAYEMLVREELNSRVGPLIFPLMRLNYGKAA